MCDELTMKKCRTPAIHIAKSAQMMRRKNWFVGPKPNRSLADLSEVGFEVVLQVVPMNKRKQSLTKAEVRGIEASI
jgi:hypothetical protein